jgi:hypothetical protein
MHPRMVELVSYAALQREALLVAVDRVSPDLRDRRVHPGVWSVGEILEHLHRVENGVARLVLRTIERAEGTGITQERETGSLLHSLDHLGLLHRDRHVAAPDMVIPRGEYTAAEALEALVSSREALLASIRTGDGLALGTLTFPHPLLGSLTLYQWILFVGQHEERHAAQIGEIARSWARTQ